MLCDLSTVDMCKLMPNVPRVVMLDKCFNRFNVGYFDKLRLAFINIVGVLSK